MSSENHSKRLSNRHKEMGKEMRRERSFNYYEQVLYAKERPGPGKGMVMHGKAFRVLHFNSQKKEKTSW